MLGKMSEEPTFEYPKSKVQIESEERAKEKDKKRDKKERKKKIFEDKVLEVQ